jgi:hypothetical protein
MFRKLDLFLSSGEVREIPTLLGPLESANLNHWTTHQTQSHVTTDGQSVSQSVRLNVKPLLVLTTRCLLMLRLCWEPSPTRGQVCRLAVRVCSI